MVTATWCPQHGQVTAAELSAAAASSAALCSLRRAFGSSTWGAAPVPLAPASTRLLLLRDGLVRPRPLELWTAVWARGVLPPAAKTDVHARTCTAQ